MLLAIDIGNTNTGFGLFKGRKLVKRFDLPTAGLDLVRLRRIMRGRDISACVICSVVPGATAALKRGISLLTGRQPYIIGKDIKVPVKNLYRRKSQVGQDRLVNAYAASFFYGVPAIVVDFGTAVTFDVISRQGAYMGGMILPGLQLGLDALAQRTALLPALKLARPLEFIGRDSKNSILSGVVFGLASAVEEMCRRIKARIGRDARVIGTGGNIGVIRPFCGQIRYVDRDLTLKGTDLIFREKCEK